MSKFKTVDDLIKSNRWTTNGPTQFDSSSNYAGENLSDYIVVIGRSRDSGCLTNCNFDVALDRLGGESTECDGETPQAVKVGHFGHWACGWYELILVHESALDKLETAREILNDLDNYPVLDEDEFSQREHDEQSETLECYKSEFRRELLKFLSFKNPDIVPRGRIAADMDLIIDHVYRDDCGYRGEGWVCKESISRYFDGDGKWELDEMASAGSRLAKALFACGIAQRPERKAAI